ENTGASGRSRIITVSPLSSFLTVMRFSNEAISWAVASVHTMKSARMHGVLGTFIEPPTAKTNFEITRGKGSCQTSQYRIPSTPYQFRRIMALIHVDPCKSVAEFLLLMTPCRVISTGRQD